MFGFGSKQWTSEEIPDQTGRVIIVTGANTGIGYETVKASGSLVVGPVLALMYWCEGPVGQERQGLCRLSISRESKRRYRKAQSGDWEGSDILAARLG